MTTRDDALSAFHRAFARTRSDFGFPSSATFAERERRRGAGRRGRRGRVRPSARDGHAHGGGAAVRRAGCEDPGKADSLHGEQVAPRQGEGLQRVPLQAQRAPRHSQSRSGVMIRRNTRCETSPRVTHARRPSFLWLQSEKRDARGASDAEATRRGARVFSMIRRYTIAPRATDPYSYSL